MGYNASGQWVPDGDPEDVSGFSYANTDPTAWYTDPFAAQLEAIQNSWQGGANPTYTTQMALDAIRDLNLQATYDPETESSSWADWLSSSTGQLSDEQLISTAMAKAMGTINDPTNILTSAINKLKTATGLSSSELGLGGVGILGALAALTSKPATRQETSSQTGTSTQNTSGTTSQQQTGTSNQQQTGTQTQTQTGTQAQTSETTLPQWYLDLVKQQATGATQLKGMDAFGKTMLDMPIEQYMNPYLEQVANPIMRRMAEDQAKQQQEFDAQRVARGAFGSGRADLLSNQMQERQALERENTLGNMYSQAFGNAQGVAGQDLGRMFQEWQAMQQDPRNLAQAQAGILSTLKPGQITTSTGTTAGTTTGTTTGSTTGTTTGSTTGATTGTTTGTQSTSGTASSIGTDPNKIEKLANMAGTVWGLANA